MRTNQATVDRRLEGKVALITGGASGIGEATVRLFVKHGAKVVIADIQDERGQSICEELGGEETISYIHCDVTNDSNVGNAVDLAVSKYGKLDVMFNNAGIGDVGIRSILSTSNEQFKKVLEVNLYGAFLGAKHAARVMIPAKSGIILFTASVGSVINWGTGSTGYVTSKHAVVGLAKNLCVELGQYGIRVNCVSPNVIATSLVCDGVGMASSSIDKAACEAAILKGVVLKSEDVADAALFLASDESKYVSGLNLVIDGGYSQVNPSLSQEFSNVSLS